MPRDARIRYAWGSMTNLTTANSHVECFELLSQDGAARTGVLKTAHGSVRTPVFMPVGTKATVKGFLPSEVEDLGAQIILGNTYHLMQRPGFELIQRAGGLHRFMHWHRPILTDSGGFQVFSLKDTLKLNDEGVAFSSVYDGAIIQCTPESIADAQVAIGSDIAMVLDECPSGDSDTNAVADAVRRTSLWAARARERHLDVRRDGKDSRWSYTGQPQLQFGIVQGGVDQSLRARSARDLVDIGFDGYAIGGLSVGEDPQLTMPAVEAVNGLLPVHQPRYYMGIGDPVGVLDVIHRGVDMFDCVLPTRLGRTATAMVPSQLHPKSRLNLRNAVHRDDPGPIDPNCACPTCTEGFSRSYLRHLFQQSEMLGPRLVSNHNLHVMLSIVWAARHAIAEGRWNEHYATERERWNPLVAASLPS